MSLTPFTFCLLSVQLLAEDGATEVANVLVFPFKVLPEIVFHNQMAYLLVGESNVVTRGDTPIAYRRVKGFTLGFAPQEIGA